MKLLLTTIAAVVLVGCGKSAQESSTEVKAPDISIHDAAAGGVIEAVKQHIAAGTDVNAKDEDGYTPLHFAVVNDDKELAELLIAAGADVNAKTDMFEMTPLHHAVELGNKEIVELLIAKGADVNAKRDGETPLDWADDEIADLLRKHGGKTSEELKAEGK